MTPFGTYYHVEDLPTHCSVCGKKLDVVEVLFNGLRGYCSTHESGATQVRQKPVCDICAMPLRGRHAHYVDGLYYCDEHIPSI